jgi:hypothetical protein
VKLLRPPELLTFKKHDNLAIMGTGYSINWITAEQWNVIDERYDTFGMNWYCKKKRPTTWYLIREQCATNNRVDKDHTLDEFYDCLGYYRDTIKIIKDMSYRRNNYQHAMNLHLIDGLGYVFNEIYGGCSAKSMLRTDIFTEGICHGKCTLYDAIHFAMGMGYKRILFCGIDLYDSRCFYKGYDETLPAVLLEGRNCAAPHLTADNTTQLIKKLVTTWNIPLFVQNKRSLLATIIPVWEGV